MPTAPAAAGAKRARAKSVATVRQCGMVALQIKGRIFECDGGV
jgi:hypothetical protein